MEVPLFTWGVITALAALVWASSLVNKFVPNLVILALAYTSTAVAIFMYMRLKWIRSQLSPMPMTKATEQLVSAGTSDSANADIKVGTVPSARTPLLFLASDKVEPTRSRRLSSIHTAVESKLLGKEVGMGWHEPLYLLRPPPDAKLKRQSRQYQLYPFGQHGVHLMTRVRTAQPCGLIPQCSPGLRLSLSTAHFFRIESNRVY